MDSNSRDSQDDMAYSRTSSSSGRRATRELFLSNTATVRRRNESDISFLARVTHLRLQNRGISSFGTNGNAFDVCPSLKVLYLYDNCVESIKGLERLRQLEQLHADNNLLRTVQGTLPCARLTKLHLSGNCIETVCGLESARYLEELYVGRQHLARGKTFTIDRASVDGIKDSLLVLDAPGNGIGGEAIEAVLDLYRLERLNLADNNLQEMAQVVDVVTSLEGLTECDLRGNAVSRKPKYFERAVTRCGDSLTTLDGKPVHAQHREMLQSLDRHKRAEARKNAGKVVTNSAHPAPMAELGGTKRRLGELPPSADISVSSTNHSHQGSKSANHSSSGDSRRDGKGPQGVWLVGGSRCA